MATFSTNGKVARILAITFSLRFRETYPRLPSMPESTTSDWAYIELFHADSRIRYITTL